MQVEGCLQALGVVLGEKSSGSGNSTCSSVAGPAQIMAGLIGLARGQELVFADMPAHVDDEHVQRHIVLVEAAHQLVEFLIAVIQ